MVETDQKKHLTASDRCDKCGAQAFVLVRGMAGELLFCSHDYNEIVNNPIAYENIMDFMVEIQDERDKLIQNRLQGDD